MTKLTYLMIKSLVFPILAFFLVVLPINLEAREIVFGTDLNFSEETTDNNYYIVGGNLRIDSVFQRDLVLVAGKMHVTGQVLQDTIIIGGEINLENYVAGDLRIFGGKINLSSTVEGDLVVIGGRVNLLKNADIRGETIIIGGEVKQNAALRQDADIIAASIFINNEIGGESEITTQNIIFEPGARITGNLHYYAPEKAIERQGFEISGTANFNQINTFRETGIVKTTIINILSFWIILRFITTLIITFILIQLFKVFTQGVNDIAVGSFFKSFFTGLFSLILVPTIFIILLVSLIGLPVGLLFVLIYILIISLSSAFAGIIVGSLVRHLLDKKTENKVTFQNAAIGIVLLTTLQFVDWFGDLTILVFNLVAIGATIRFIFRSVAKKN